MDGKNGERELLHTVEHHTHEVVLLNTEVDELTGQRIRMAVHLAIRQLTVLIDHGRCVGCAENLFAEEIRKGLAQVNVQRFAGTQSDDALDLCVTHDTDAVQCSLGLRHHPLQCHRHRISQALHQTGGILSVVVVDAHAPVKL